MLDGRHGTSAPFTLVPVVPAPPGGHL